MKNDIDFEWIAPIDLHQWWDRVRTGLIEVKKHGDTWLPEDVYMSLRSQQSFLAIATKNDAYAGFVITQNIESHDGMVLHVWAAYGEQSNLLLDASEHVEEWARKINATRTTFDSSRKAWGKVAEKIGYHPTMTRYEKRIS